MDNISASLAGWWQGLQAREQQVLRFGGILLGLLLIYLSIIDPIHAARTRAEQNLEATRGIFTEMLQQAADIKASGLKPGMASSGSLLTLVERSAQEQGLRDGLKSLQPTSKDQIQVTLEGASYQQLMQWLIELHRQGISARRADIQSDPKDKLLRVQLLLSR